MLFYFQQYLSKINFKSIKMTTDTFSKGFDVSESGIWTRSFLLSLVEMLFKSTKVFFHMSESGSKTDQSKQHHVHISALLLVVTAT